MLRFRLLAALLVLLVTASGAAAHSRLSAEPLGAEQALGWNASVTVELANKKEISSVLYGIFFEEVGGRRHDGLAPTLSRFRLAIAPALPGGSPITPPRGFGAQRSADGGGNSRPPCMPSPPPPLPPAPQVPLPLPLLPPSSPPADRPRRRWRPVRRAGAGPLL
jgi:hypothetical protein